MLTVKNLHARVGDKEILRGIDLRVKAGEVHAIMGPDFEVDTPENLLAVDRGVQIFYL